jgi:hypothetical protein
MRRPLQIPPLCFASAFFLLTAIILLTAVGCTDPNPFYHPDPLLPGQCRRGVEVSETFDEFELPEQLDILVVVDDSGSVERTQEAFADALPGFLETLHARGISLRVGVVTTDGVGPAGLAPPGTIREGCAQNTGVFADSESLGDWTRVAACNVVQGAGGQPRQQALAVIKISVVEQPGTLAEFLRPRARLLIMVVSNEDDCSSGAPLGGDGAIRDQCARSAGQLSDISEWVSAIRAQAATPQGVSMAVFSGPPTDHEISGDETIRPACQGALGAAYPANRLWQAASLLGEYGVFESLCTDDLSFSLSAVADRLAEPAPVTLCPAQRMVHEPLEVGVVAADGSASSVPLGEEGFLYFGSTDACERGALSVSPGILADAESIDVRYCVDP